MSCYSTSSAVVVSGDSCISPQQFDSMVDYNSTSPFSQLNGPSSDSKIKTYWNRGDVKAKVSSKLVLTWSEYISYQSLKNMVTKSITIPSGNSYIGKGNGCNNPTNVSLGKISKLYGGTTSKKMSDGQKNAVFPNMESGLATSMHFYIEQYHGKNLCQLNNQHQGYYTKDCTEIHDGIGMAALRLRWVTDNSKRVGIKPNEQLNMKDKETLYAMVSSGAKSENGLTFQRGFLDKAYALVKNK